MTESIAVDGMSEPGQWMVIGNLCMDGWVTGSVLERFDPTNTEPDPGEVIRIGPDWRPLLDEAIRTVHGWYPDRRISAQCMVVYTEGWHERLKAGLPADEHELEVLNEVVRFVYRLADELTPQRRAG